MELSKEKIIGSIGSFVFVLLLFSGAWYYLDQQRVATLEAEKNAYKMKLEADLALKEAKSIQANIEIKERMINKSIEKHSQDEELSGLTLKFIDEVSDINFHQRCGDDPEHNSKARKAKALLQLIEAKAKEYGRQDVLDSFVEKQKNGIGGWSATCRS